MEIYVLLKRTFDTEEAIQLENGQIDEDGAEFIINPYDEYAVEEAIRVRDAQGGTVTVVTVGPEDADKELRTALAMGADQAVRISIEDDIEEADHFTISEVLAGYLKEQTVDLVIAGNVAVDGGSGQVAPRVAELLDIPYVTTITKLELDGTKAIVTRDAEGDTETIETTLPLLVTAQQGLNEPRYPSLPGIMKAKKKPLEELELDDLELDEDELAPRLETIERFLPPNKAAGKILEGELNEQVAQLASLLRNEAKVV
ncbi:MULTISPECIES: electron transfer flavoprotein subunit beta/FixA family protein [Exiguobacterium]|uniref:Electron transfer flavoprotein subunit beta n=1 Tax=Exiguobacterium acetylicum TaxID=41170 RepID=A0ABX8G6V5_EXIAC|nr:MULTISPECIES: electron transfer flavoprotein subunit beta/FixA family protein [Exiguobacterium]AOT01349.1 electron transfer flavoprotein subunit beta [Exiguobacterium sp. U13-1]QWB29305.1 electron transfer flavoprotein subunit beta/FixA family protein [Exiguobacterium acetylicum]HBQ77417.1 electron transfer flavoprotein subunit beta/FixA family protein [Exiguobacterium sp.]HCD58272.1 electron transfer flavoprotein subunit beta/FixA family protein [Exiguobacterium sp.]